MTEHMDEDGVKAEVSIPVGAVVECRRVDHPWADWSWCPVAAVIDPPKMDDWHTMVSEGDVTRFHAGTKMVTLHRKLVESYRINLALETPSLWIMLDAVEPGEAQPWKLSAITACPYDAQDLADSGEGILEQVPTPEDLVAVLVELVRAHPLPEEFRKWRRDEVKVEELKFGKEPIFAKRPGTPPSAGEARGEGDEGCKG
ncbi:DUF3305 domain-containing protein [Breoghania sp.]|uniref:DUF3305 domain-containing protein n=1 Tax=Breoghania sp. TaxID=2065378 RepID=UPI00261E7A02|nr:DUF3305 domain-containing protein [Breoghania sp.]MDJ0931424.1 DUF3305 domain-containing protein [Breoghania sp.]